MGKGIWLWRALYLWAREPPPPSTYVMPIGRELPLPLSLSILDRHPYGVLERGRGPLHMLPPILYPMQGMGGRASLGRMLCRGPFYPYGTIYRYP